MKKYKGKYRNGTFRARWWDYSASADYFVTILTKHRNRYFGDIENGTMNLSPIGEVASHIWGKIPDHYPSVTLDEYVIMPDHMHGILRLRNSRKDNKPPSLGSVVGSYKAAVTREARKVDPSFEWHTRYHDRIIRDEHEYINKVYYIRDNPKRWP